MQYAIGIDLGGTNIKYALVAKDAQIIQQSKIPTQAEKGREVVIKNIENCCLNLLDYAKEHQLEVIGVGIGTPGIIDNGLVLGGAENLPEWESLPLGGILSRRLNHHVFVDNDANLMGLGEVRYGNAQQLNDAIFITVGTGIGGAMVLNGSLYGGHRNRGAELGHIFLDPNGNPCSCGSIGCLEAQASVPALIKDYSENMEKSGRTISEEINGELIVKAYLNEQPEAVESLNKHMDALASGLAGFINIFSPQKIIIGGGISECGDFYLDYIREKTYSMAMKETSIFTQIEQAKLGNKAGYMGAAALVFDKLDISLEQEVMIKNKY